MGNTPLSCSIYVVATHRSVATRYLQIYNVFLILYGWTLCSSSSSLLPVVRLIFNPVLNEWSSCLPNHFCTAVRIEDTLNMYIYSSWILSWWLLPWKADWIEIFHPTFTYTRLYVSLYLYIYVCVFVRDCRSAHTLTLLCVWGGGGGHKRLGHKKLD